MSKEEHKNTKVYIAAMGRVQAVRCVWAHVPTSRRDRRLRQLLPEAPGVAMLIRY
jgi:hypothetical protein